MLINTTVTTALRKKGNNNDKLATLTITSPSNTIITTSIIGNLVRAL